MTSNVLSEEHLPWGEVLVSPVLPIARHPGLSALATFYAWSIALALLMPILLPTTILVLQKKKKYCSAWQEVILLRIRAYFFLSSLLPEVP